MSSFDLEGLDDGPDDSDSSEDISPEPQSLYQQTVDLCGGPDLMQLFGPSGSGKSTFAFEVLKSAIKDNNKDALIIDTERNVLKPEDIEGADYVYVPEWHDLYYYVIGKAGQMSDNPFGENTTNHKTIQDGYDIVLLDSIGFPALVQYGEYRVADDADQFRVFNELQVITGKLKQYSQRNSALTIVTNQPKSELSAEADPNPFGDKSVYGFKEIWKTSKISSSELETTCDISAFRSRFRGRGSTIFELKVTSSGNTVKYKDEGSDDGWV